MLLTAARVKVCATEEVFALLERLNLAETMIRAGARHDPSVNDRRLLAKESQRLSPRAASRRVARLAYPSMFLLVPASVLAGIVVSWTVTHLGGPNWLQAILGYGIAFVPPAVFLSLNAFLWTLRLRRHNAVKLILLGNASRSLWSATIVGYCIAVGATALAYARWPDAFI
ncbi:hypothetical protein DFJ67_1134 [Asanoa ferruginea]|uniref:Uncharacterized protein n=1 Tax=Asanoa ferruginea TaxID=53367 RepID=A0A3D9ZFF2_9ACTN|nr:hypothetical protein [Asanoa ferruginea]REF95182.1 hypothetical protein DFJ67_1134 [Asanoa ferruginea]GIF53402.1 hypothetical protein Afe04nite_79410 [Asanoa ferruginea]